MEKALESRVSGPGEVMTSTGDVRFQVGELLDYEQVVEALGEGHHILVF